MTGAKLVFYKNFYDKFVKVLYKLYAVCTIFTSAFF